MYHNSFFQLYCLENLKNHFLLEIRILFFYKIHSLNKINYKDKTKLKGDHKDKTN